MLVKVFLLLLSVGGLFKAGQGSPRIDTHRGGYEGASSYDTLARRLDDRNDYMRNYLHDGRNSKVTMNEVSGWFNGISLLPREKAAI